MRKLHLASLALLMLLTALSGVALSPVTHISQSLITPVLTLPGIISTPGTDILQVATPTSAKIKPAALSLVKQAGNSDRIVLIGILIFGIIVVPIILKRKEWLGK